MLVDNSDRLAGAVKRGTMPYFIANNAKYTDPNWKPSKATAIADPMPVPCPKTAASEPKIKSVSSPGAEQAGNRTRTTCERLRSEVRDV